MRAPERNDHSPEVVAEAFEKAFRIEAINDMYILASAIIIALAVWSLGDTYLKKTNDKKVFFDLLLRYGKLAAVIFLFPFALRLIEELLVLLQDGIMSYYSDGSLSKTLWKNIADEKAIMLNKLEEEQGEFWKFLGVNSPSTVFSYWYYSVVIEIDSFFTIMIKKTYLFMCCGRYLWLGMLKIMAPIAIACSIHEKTRQYFLNWLKYMLLNYLLIPVFLFAEIFSEGVMLVFTESVHLAEIGVFGIIGMFILKGAMFTTVSKRISNLI